MLNKKRLIKNVKNMLCIHNDYQQSNLTQHLGPLVIINRGFYFSIYIIHCIQSIV